MKNQIKTILSLFSTLVITSLYSQPLEDMVPYDDAFIFREGLYLSLEDWQSNDPIPVERIITDIDKTDQGFFEQLLKEGWITFVDDSGTTREIRSPRFFGYCVDNLVFNRNHFRIGIIGAISHYTDFKGVFHLEQLIYQGKDPALLIPQIAQGEKASQYIIDFENGEVLDFNRINVETIFRRDPELYKMYKKAKGKRKEKLYQYIFEYNKRHPVYFPS